MPSRDFLIRQAVLNATLNYHPKSFEYLGLSEGLGYMVLGDWVSPSFCDAVRAEFRKLVDREAGHAAHP